MNRFQPLHALSAMLILLSALYTTTATAQEDITTAAPQEDITTGAAQDEPTTDTTAQWSESQQIAWTLLQDMALQLSAAPKFQVDFRVGYDVLQDTGQKMEFSELRHISLERPALLLNEVQKSDGTEETILFDGEWITISDTKAKVYARAPQPGDIDATVKYFVRDLGMRMPLAAMLMSQFPQELERRVIDITYVEETTILGEPAHHLAGRTTEVDFQVWLSADRDPLPLRIILTYRNEAGQPQFWANFSGWKFNPSFLRKAFEFEPREDAREVALVTQFTTDSEESADTAAPSSPGEQP